MDRKRPTTPIFFSAPLRGAIRRIPRTLRHPADPQKKIASLREDFQFNMVVPLWRCGAKLVSRNTAERRRSGVFR